ncbi:MAG: hypothetical protein F6J93_40075 [Oscillatoria sp. SIO1A7]|nr:hypothetical protein [Oscillatoria sp. SIO1A7]
MSDEYKAGYKAGYKIALAYPKFQQYLSSEELAKTGLEPYLKVSNWPDLRRLLAALACCYGDFPKKLKDVSCSIGGLDWPNVNWDCEISESFALGLGELCLDFIYCGLLDSLEELSEITEPEEGADYWDRKIAETIDRIQKQVIQNCFESERQLICSISKDFDDIWRALEAPDSTWRTAISPVSRIPIKGDFVGWSIDLDNDNDRGFVGFGILYDDNFKEGVKVFWFVRSYPIPHADSYDINNLKVINWFNDASKKNWEPVK